MAKRKSSTITLSATVDGEKRKWELTREEFDEFLLRFEENELIDVSEWPTLAGFKVVEAEAPARR